MIRIILVSMVRNESHIIERMIASALPVVDAIALVDTGSTDDTIDKAIAAAGSTTCMVAERPWADFSTNRNQALEAGRRCAADMGWDLSQCWLLLLDADHVLKIAPSFQKTAIECGADCLRITQEDGAIKYRNARLLRASATANYLGRTHEFLSVEKNCDFNALGIDDRNDGGNRSSKYARDIALLMLDWKDAPNGRTAFYLAQTYRNMEDYASALNWYGRRIRMGLPHETEEIWYSRLSRGRCYVGLKDFESAQAELATAFIQRPWRSESLLDLARIKLDLQQHREACALARQGLTIPLPETDFLFIEKSAYAWDFIHILSIGCGYINQEEMGRTCCEKLRLSRGSPHRDNALDNSRFYVEKLVAVVTQIPFSPEPGWHACNPSIINNGSGYDVCVRTVNYSIELDHQYKYEGSVQTRNFLLSLSSDLKPWSQLELENPVEFPSPVTGAEDVRLYTVLDGVCTQTLYAVATSCAWAPTKDGCRARPRLRSLQWTSTGALLGTEVLHGFGPDDICEKNWLPFVDRGRHLVIYSHNPFRIVDLNTKETILQQTVSSLDLSGFRGSSAPIRWDGGWLYSVHETSYSKVRGLAANFYLHRLCWMDENYALKKFSQLFYFDRLGVEFCAGMASHPDGVIMTFGVHDCEAKMAIVKTETIAAMLKRHTVL